MFDLSNTPARPEPSYNSKRTAKILDTNERRVTKMIREGRLDAFKIGRQWRVTASAIRDLQQSGGK
jgi:excisionase family DNA binding protein